MVKIGHKKSWKESVQKNKTC